MYRGDDYYDGLIKREEEIINKLKHKIEQHTVLEEDKTKIDNGYLKKDELLDVDGKKYCDVYVIIQSTFENPQDHQNNCSIAYKFYLKCNKYKDKGYKDGGSK